MSIVLKSYLIAAVVTGLILGSSLLFLDFVLAETASTSVTVGNAAPSVSAVNITPDPIIPTENTTTTITITATITDSNGCDDVFASGTITAVLFRSGVGASCAADDNNCYTNITLTEVGNTCTGGSDTAGDASGTVPIFFFAEATDASSTFPGETWQAQVKAVDDASASSTATDGTPPEMNSVYALIVDGTIAYGALAANTDTGTDNATTTVTNTGNFKVDTEVSGTDMTDGGNTLNANEQKYGTSSVTYASLTFTLSTTPTARDLDIVKATSSSTPSTVDTFWGINIPIGQAVGNYTGTDTFTAIYGGP